MFIFLHLLYIKLGFIQGKHGIIRQPASWDFKSFMNDPHRIFRRLYLPPTTPRTLSPASAGWKIYLSPSPFPFFLSLFWTHDLTNTAAMSQRGFSASHIKISSNSWDLLWNPMSAHRYYTENCWDTCINYIENLGRKFLIYNFYWKLKLWADHFGLGGRKICRPETSSAQILPVVRGQRTGQIISQNSHSVPGPSLHTLSPVFQTLK